MAAEDVILVQDDGTVLIQDDGSIAVQTMGEIVQFNTGDQSIVGDIPEFTHRLRLLLPERWFPDVSPLLTALLQGFSKGWADLYALLANVRLQGRLLTVDGDLLALAAADYRGAAFLRRSGESDGLFRKRLLPIFREHVTRPALTDRLQDLTGHTPNIFEPARPADTGGYGLYGGYGVAGRYGSLNLPAQLFVDVDRPIGLGIANVAGYGSPAGGYGVGSIEYATLDMEGPHVTDADIYEAVADTIPAGVTAWVRLGGTSYDYVVDPALIGTAPLDAFNLDLNVLA